MKSHTFFKTAVFASLVVLSGLSGRSLAAGDIDLADRPLYLQGRVTPSFIMAVDDSGSMQWDILSPNQDGMLFWSRDNASSDYGFFTNSGALRGSGGITEWLELFPYPGRGTRRKAVPPIPAFGFARSPEFNASYYNPSVEYRPWLNYDGTPYPSMNSSTQWKSMKVDPRDTSALRYDLTQPIRDQSNDSASGTVQIIGSTNLYDEFILKNGWRIRSVGTAERYCPYKASGGYSAGTLTVPGNGSSAMILTRDYVVSGPCTGGDNGQVNIWMPNQIDTPELTELFHLGNGMVLPAGTDYFLRALCPALGASTTASIGTWVTATSDVTWSLTTCRQDGAYNPSATTADTIGISYFAPTYYLTTATSPDGNTAPTMFDKLKGGPRAGTNPGAGIMYRYEIKPANYGSTADYEKAMTNFANWFLYYRNRNLAMVAALTHSMSDIEAMRIGFFRINQVNTSNANTNISPVVMHDMGNYANSVSVAGRRHLYEKYLIPLNGNGSTPNGWAVNQLGKQFQRTTGTTNPVSPPPIVNACQFNAGMLFTDGYHNGGRPQIFDNVDVDPPFHGVVPFTDTHKDTLADIAAYYYKNNLRPDLLPGQVPAPGCSGSSPDPWLDCNRDPHMNFYGITLGAAGEYFDVTYKQNPATFEITPNVYTTAPAWKAWSDGGRSAVDDLWHATLNARGEFINATTPENISAAMNRILTAVNERASVSGGTAASGTRREDGFLAYVPHYDPKDWTGNIKANELTDSGVLGDLKWDAAALLNAKALNQRNVYYIDDSGTRRKLDAGTTFLPTSTAAALDKVVSDLCPGAPGHVCTRDDVIEYLRGDHSKEVRNGGPFRNRTLNDNGIIRSSRIGDILGSQPEVLNKASYGYSALPNTMGGNTYMTFLNGTKQSRTQLVFVGSNDGMIHAFNAVDGNEDWALIPNSVLTDNIATDGSRIDSSRAIFTDLARPSYEHRYFVDGSPRQGDVYDGTNWKTYLAVPMGAGARSVVVLDVTSGAGQTEPTVVSEITHNDIGYGVDRPRIAPLQNKKWALVFGNGYNSNSNASKLVVHDLAGGSTTVSNAGTGTAADPNGMSGSVATADDDFDGLADRIYAGDYKGDLWKFPVPTSGNIVSASTPLFRARSAAGGVQHITGGIDVITHPQSGQIVYFGTGRYLLEADRALPASPPVETFYAVWDSTAVAPATTLTRSSLTAQTLSAATPSDGAIIRTTSSNPVPWGAATGNGWYLDLAAGGVAQGERFVGVPTVALGQVIFTTFMPNADSDECASSGINFVNAVDAATGSGFLSHGGNTTVGSIRLPDSASGGGPVATPPVVVTPPPPACDPADPGCAPPDIDPSNPTDPTVTPIGAVGCVSNLGILLSDGLLNFAELTCGRQSWRQVE